MKLMSPCSISPTRRTVIVMCWSSDCRFEASVVVYKKKKSEKTKIKLRREDEIIARVIYLGQSGTRVHQCTIEDVRAKLVLVYPQ